jgi:hypothetical protein
MEAELKAEPTSVPGSNKTIQIVFVLLPYMRQLHNH